ncbi:MAG: hypothetical protein GZ089_03210 [Aromatoleum sp.]|nr:hypothetical protein [Aromatoleum sp.]
MLKRFAAPLRTLAVALWVALSVAGCASTSIQVAWYDTSYTGGPFRKIVVVGIHNNIANRRVFEDIFAQKLNAAGVQGVPGYLVLPNDANLDEPTASAAILKAGADGLLTVRLLSVDTKTRVSTTMMPAGGLYGPGMGWGGWWGPSMVAVPEVTQYDVANVETNLWNVNTKRVVWAATTDTFNPRSVATETPGFADLIIGQLRARGLVPAGR